MQLPPRASGCIDATKGDAFRRAVFKMGLVSTTANTLLTGLALIGCDARYRIVALVLAVNAAAGYGIARRLRATANAAFEKMTAFAGAADTRLRSVEAANSELRMQLRAHQDAAATLRDADRRKDEFLATLAHELRNPLAPIRHAVKLLDARTANPQQQQWGRAVISRQVQRMALLLDDLLDVARITRGHLNLKIEVVELRSVVEAALEVARPLMEAKQQRLVVTMPEEPLMVSGDSLRLSQCLSNLLTNAAKYTDERGCITFTAALSDNELKLAVRDTGIGIDPDSIGGIFEIFSQVHSAVDRAEGGLGIGLALVKGLAELHGGRVEVALYADRRAPAGRCEGAWCGPRRLQTAHRR
jgi:signal transduction histidine kinase